MNRLKTSSTLQSRFQVAAYWPELMIPHYRGTLCDHLLPAVTNNWTHGAAQQHRPNKLHDRPSSVAWKLLLISSPVEVGSWPARLGHTVGQQLAQRSLQVIPLRFAPATWKLRVRYSPTRPLAPTEAHGCQQLAQSCYPAVSRTLLTISPSRVRRLNHYTTELNSFHTITVRSLFAVN